MSVPNPIKIQLKQLDAEVIEMPEWGDWSAMMWRFYSVSDANVEVAIMRDTDSRLNKREATAVKAFLDSSATVHILRDHPYHKFSLMPGMCGFKRGACPQMALLIRDIQIKGLGYGFDYNFFSDKVLPNIDKSNIIIHDEFFGGRPYPTKRVGLEFVGEVFDEFDKPDFEHREILKKPL